MYFETLYIRYFLTQKKPSKTAIFVPYENNSIVYFTAATTNRPKVEIWWDNTFWKKSSRWYIDCTSIILTIMSNSANVRKVVQDSGAVDVQFLYLRTENVLQAYAYHLKKSQRIITINRVGNRFSNATIYYCRFQM